jgi:hypothetical protein
MSGHGGLCSPDPEIRLVTWRAIALKHISAEMCLRLARFGFSDLALELLRQRGELP